MRSFSWLLVSFSVLLNVADASKWNGEIDMDLREAPPRPTSEPLLYNNPGTVMMRPYGSWNDEIDKWTGRLAVRQETCADPTYIYTCPDKALPCCPPGYPTCCPDGCCTPNHTCCGAYCCGVGHTCVNGGCVDPAASLLSVQSLAAESSSSVASVESVSSASVLLQSISSELAAQTQDTSNPDSINTVNVYPSDPRIVYDPLSSWSSTSSSSTIGFCQNGTAVTSSTGASFSFVFRGTDIALLVIPHLAAGSISVQIDGQPASTFDTIGVSESQCAATQVFRQTLTDGAHQITVKNVDAGTLEFNSLTYTGKGAYGEAIVNPAKKKTSMVGAAVGGAIGGIAVLVLAVILIVYFRRRANKQNAAPTTPATPNQPMMYQQPTTPYSPPSQPSYLGLQHPSTPGTTHGGYPGSAEVMHPGQDRFSVGGTSPPSTIAPLPMWVERPRGSVYEAPPPAPNQGYAPGPGPQAGYPTNA